MNMSMTEKKKQASYLPICAKAYLKKKDFVGKH
jgi:hypothetical protein